MVMYAAMERAVLAHEREWERRTPPTDARIQCLDAREQRVVCGTFGDGLWRSEDGGETWTSIDVAENVMSVTFDPNDPDRLWIGTEPSAVYRSADGGETWTDTAALTDLPSASEWSFPPRPDTHHVRWIAVAPDDPEHLYVGIEAGALVQTHDGGETWEDHVSTARRDNHTLVTHPDAPERVYAAAGDGYAETHDSGETWRHPQQGLDHRYVWSVAVDPGDPDTVLVSSASGPRSAHAPERAESYVYRRRDGQWQRCLDGLPGPEGMVRPVLTAGSQAQTAYALTNHGCYRSTDAGESWQLVGEEWEQPLTNQRPRGLVIT